MAPGFQQAAGIPIKPELPELFSKAPPKSNRPEPLGAAGGRIIMRTGFLITLCLLAPLLSAQTVYRQVDAEGNISFSDQATPGAEAITIRKAQTIAPPPVGAFRPEPAVKKEAQAGYDRLAIVRPRHDETIVGAAQGNFDVKVDLRPALRAGDSLILLLNGARAERAKTTNFTFSNLYRGAHTLQVAVSSAEDKVIQRSATVTVHVKRTANLDPALAPDPNILSPLNPPRPKPPAISPTNPPRPVVPEAPAS